MARTQGPNALFGELAEIVKVDIGKSMVEIGKVKQKPRIKVNKRGCYYLDMKSCDRLANWFVHHILEYINELNSPNC